MHTSLGVAGTFLLLLDMQVFTYQVSTTSTFISYFYTTTNSQVTHQTYSAQKQS